MQEVIAQFRVENDKQLLNAFKLTVLATEQSYITDPAYPQRWLRICVTPACLPMVVNSGA